MSRFVDVKEKRSIELTWDVEMDANDTSTELDLLATTRFEGNWSILVRVSAPREIKVNVNIKGVAAGAIGGNFKPAARISWLSEDEQSTAIYEPVWSLSPSFPRRYDEGVSFTTTPAHLDSAQKANNKFDPSTHRRYRLQFFAKDMDAPVSLVESIPRHQIALQVTPAFASRYPNDVRLVFPHANNAELWATSNVLASASPYFKTLFESDFAENVHRGGGSTPQIEDTETNASQVAEIKKNKEVERPGSAAETVMKDARPSVDDSDDETDDLLVSRGGDDEETSNKEEPTYREVAILEASYSTYRALLLYLLTSHIKFARLSSTLLPHNASSKTTRSSHIEAFHTANPTLPLPVSPKSIYRLAHVLEIPSLLAVSLDNIKSQLTVSNAARELFSDTSALYDEVRSVILEFVVANWAEIKESEGMKEMERKTVAGEMPRAGAVLFKLMALVSK